MSAHIMKISAQWLPSIETNKNFDMRWQFYSKISLIFWSKICLWMLKGNNIFDHVLLWYFFLFVVTIITTSSFNSILDQINSSERLISDDYRAFEYYKPELFASVSFPVSVSLKEQVWANLWLAMTDWRLVVTLWVMTCCGIFRSNAYTFCLIQKKRLWKYHQI